MKDLPQGLGVYHQRAGHICSIGYELIKIQITLKWASTRENLSSVFANNKDAEQPAHLRSLISVFVFDLLQSIISKLCINKKNIF